MTEAVRLGNLFSDDERDVGILRLLILVRQGDSILHALGNLDKAEARYGEDQFLLMGLFMSSSKELVDALCYLDGNGYIAEICDKKFNPREDLRLDAIEAKSFLNKDDPNSLYSRLLKKVRNFAGYHVQHQEVKSALSRNKDAVVRLASVSGEEKQVDALPIVQLMVCELMGVEENDLKQDLDDLQRLHSAATRIALDLYFTKEHPVRGA
jgi:hypothetical protein